jgi:hypothetical protein
VSGRDERGELGLRVVIVMALVAALAWTIPMVFFGRQASEQAATLTGGADEPAGGVSGSEAPVDPIGRANDVQAQANLTNAIRSTQVYFAENGSYQGFDAQVAGHYEASVTYTAGAPAPGVVSVRGVTPTTVVMVTATQDGGYLCAAAQADVVTFGRADAQAPAQCSGGW